MMRRIFAASLCVLVASAVAAGAGPLTVQGPGVNPADFRVTTFASGLGYVYGMTELSDGSILAATVLGGMRSSVPARTFGSLQSSVEKRASSSPSVRG